MAELSQDRLVRKEVALGQIREIEPPQGHIYPTLAPLQSVQSDDVIFQYVSPDTDGLAPARAEDAESELSQKDDYVGSGRASIIDWALKDHYDPSDVTRYREYRRIAELGTGSGGSFPLTVDSMTEDWEAKLARDNRRRRRKLDNRLEWLTMQALDTGVIAYNDGKISFSVDYGRPVGQQDQAPASGNYTSANAAAMDPVGDLLAVQETMFDTYGVRIGRGLISRKVVNSLVLSDRFRSLSGMAGATGANPIDPNYLVPGWTTRSGGPGRAGASNLGYYRTAALDLIEGLTGISFIVYDSVYRTRALGSTTIVNNRFMGEGKVILLPSEEDLADISDTEIGFGATLTSPHAEGNFTPGFYEWERDTVDPWSYDRGTGIKAFPVFPHLDLTYVMSVTT